MTGDPVPVERRHRDPRAAVGRSRRCPTASRRCGPRTGRLCDGAPDLDGVDVVLVRLLGGRRAWEAAVRRAAPRAAPSRGIPLLAFGGEAAPDAELTAAVDRCRAASSPRRSTTWLARRTGQHRAPAAVRRRHRAASHGCGFDPPVEVPPYGVLGARGAHDPATGPTVGVVFYRAHVLAGNTQFVDDLCAAIEARAPTPLAVLVLLAAARRAGRRAGRRPASSRPASTPSSRPCWPWAAGADGDDVGRAALAAPRRAGRPGRRRHASRRRRGRTSAAGLGPARRGHGRGHPRVRRPHHRRCRSRSRRWSTTATSSAPRSRLPDRARPRRPGRRHRRAPGRACAAIANGGQARRHRAVGLPDQAQPASATPSGSTRRRR